MKIKKYIPNTLTIINMLCGTIAAAFAYQKIFEVVAVMFLVGVVMDFFDGFAARLLHVKSELGVQLDSMADLITSGLTPSVVMYALMTESLPYQYRIATVDMGTFHVPYSALFSLPAFLILIFSAIRLARFNIDTRQTDSFIGLPTPANALMIVFLPFLIHPSGTFQYGGLLLLTIICSYLLVSNVRFVSLKFKTYGWKGNTERWLLILVSIILLILLQYRAFPVIIMFYIVLSFIYSARYGDE